MAAACLFVVWKPLLVVRTFVTVVCTGISLNLSRIQLYVLRHAGALKTKTVVVRGRKLRPTLSFCAGE